MEHNIESNEKNHTENKTELEILLEVMEFRKHSEIMTRKMDFTERLCAHAGAFIWTFLFFYGIYSKWHWGVVLIFFIFTAIFWTALIIDTIRHNNSKKDKTTKK